MHEVPGKNPPRLPSFPLPHTLPIIPPPTPSPAPDTSGKVLLSSNSNPDPAKVHWVTKLQNLLTNSKTEQAAFDFKQGFLELSDNPKFDDGSFDKILEN